MSCETFFLSLPSSLDSSVIGLNSFSESFWGGSVLFVVKNF